MKSIPIGDDRLRVREAKELAHTSTAMIYRWGHEGRFGWWVVRQRNKERGVRYIDKKSFIAWLSSQREAITFGPIHPENTNATTQEVTS